LRGLLRRGLRIGEMASTASSSTFESWIFAALRTTASGIPRWSATTWRFEPAFPLSVGFGPVLCLPLFAGTLAESGETLSQSIRSASPRRFRSTLCSSSHMPASCQSRKRRQQVEPDPQPISLGSMFQGMPLFKSKMMPARTERSSMRGRPPCGLGASSGNSGSMIS
jgi:hypothetical protein